MDVYLNFDGNCREVFEFYQSVFGGEFTAVQTFADGPADLDVPEDAKTRIMHMSLPLGDNMLMGSDTMPGTPLVAGNNFSIAITAASREQCDRQFAALSDGGEVMMDLQETFWGDYFGNCRDRYGISWMFSFALQEQS